MSSLFRTRRILLLAMVALLLPLAVACSGGDDDEDTEPTDVPAAATTPEAESTPAAEMTTPEADTTSTPETEATSESDSTPEADMTGTPESDLETPEADMTGTPESAADETPEADMTGTPDSNVEGTPSTGGTDEPLGDVGDLQADLPNFTLTFNSDFENVPDPQSGTNVTSSLEMTLEQSEPGVYHLAMTSEGDQSLDIEMWSVDDSIYMAEGGGAPIELPADVGGQLIPSESLVVVPPTESLEMAEEVGQEDVSGRSATHYRLDAEQAALLLAGQGTTVTNAEGGTDIWIDDEQGFVLQMKTDNLTWTNEDGSDASATVDYMVSDIGETPDVEAPSS